MKKDIPTLLLILMAMVSCKSKAPMEYGKISSDTIQQSAVDTTRANAGKQIFITSRKFKLTNESTDQNITFVCKSYLTKHDGSQWENTEKHTVSPQETVDLNVDSDSNYNIVKYQVVGGFIGNNVEDK